MGETRLRLFEAVGIELEYMIVDRRTLAVSPIADFLLGTDGATPEAEVIHGDIAWSNELVLHVIELKTADPVASLQSVEGKFQDHVREINRRLASRGARLMPSGMHPTMDPFRETVLWPHAYGPVYRTLDAIFDCRGHGWANLQSVHINLPFGDDDEFARLHAAIRLVLPIAPALAASSPIMDGRRSEFLDARMAVYRTNAVRVPSVTGMVIPEPVSSRRQYEAEILEPIYADLAPYDADGVLRHEWVNARGAIARFDRGSVEIRVLDVQECPLADLAVAAAVVRAVALLASGAVSGWEEQNRLSTATLARILDEVIANGDQALVRDASYLRMVGGDPGAAWRVGDLWAHLLETSPKSGVTVPEWRSVWDVILQEGCLARRVGTRLPPGSGREAIHEVYAELCRCLQEGTLFR